MSYKIDHNLNIKMSEEERETRIRLQTSFQDSYLEERYPRVDQRVIGALTEEIREAEMEIELQKATQ